MAKILFTLDQRGAVVKVERVPGSTTISTILEAKKVADVINDAAHYNPMVLIGRPLQEGISHKAIYDSDLLTDAQKAEYSRIVETAQMWDFFDVEFLPPTVVAEDVRQSGEPAGGRPTYKPITYFIDP